VGFAQARRSLTSNSDVNYIDTAIVGDMLRFRFDAAYDNDVPDRAEFFYAKCGCFGTPDANGPPKPESSVDYQMVETRIEQCLTPNLSGFVELPVRFINPEQNDNAEGLGDVQVGFKYALQNCPDEVLTFQLRGYLPTGDAERGLGTDHASLEPALLLFKRLDRRSTFEAELRDWIPLDPASAEGTGIEGERYFSGNILRGGIGFGYDAIDACSWRLTPVVELVGWTVLDGIGSSITGSHVKIEEVDGDTIINAKFGLRLTGDRFGSLSVSYGHALTEKVWYDDVVRFEYRWSY
jgi:hypothetical protein